MIRTYSDLKELRTFEERFLYLKLNGIVGEETFGWDRILNQTFYSRYEWRKLRNDIITRDLGCDLGIEDRPIQGKIIIHHLNPITKDDIRLATKFLLDPEYLVCVSDNTHKAIHYGTDEFIRSNELIERKPNDTCPWKEGIV